MRTGLRDSGFATVRLDGALATEAARGKRKLQVKS
jgi:hypothetical protein